MCSSRAACFASTQQLRRGSATNLTELHIVLNFTSKPTCGLSYQPFSTEKTDMAASSAKRKALLASGTLNPHPEAVHSELFTAGEFFDPCDKAQVKYEMLRVHRVEGDELDGSFHGSGSHQASRTASIVRSNGTAGVL